MELSGEAKHALIELNSMQQQLQLIVLQRQQLEVQLEEVKAALETLKNEKEEYVYKAIGPALVKKKREDVVKSLEEAKEKLELRIKLLSDQEKKITEKIRRISEKLKELGVVA